MLASLAKPYQSQSSRPDWQLITSLRSALLVSDWAVSSSWARLAGALDSQEAVDAVKEATGKDAGEGDEVLPY